MSEESVTALFPVGGAEMDLTGRYRYRLHRTLASYGPTVLFVMLNPSTADSQHDDPTIRRCIRFAHREGAGRLEVVNLFAYRATSPAELLTADDPIGPDNDAAIAEAGAAADLVILAYGSLRNRWLSRADDVTWALQGVHEGTLWTLGSTANGCPRHPLYVRADQPLEAW